MKFKVRAPFAVHHEKIITTEQAGAQVKQRVVEPHFAGDVFEMDEKHRLKHLHKLEPADAEARELFESRYAANAEIQKARGVPTAGPTADEIKEMIKTAIAEDRASQAVATGGKRQQQQGA